MYVYACVFVSVFWCASMYVCVSVGVFICMCMLACVRARICMSLTHPSKRKIVAMLRLNVNVLVKMNRMPSTARKEKKGL